MGLIRNVMTRFDLWCEKVGKTSGYKKVLWFYITQYNYIGIGMGKFYNIRQVIGFYSYGVMILLGLKEFISISPWVFEYFFIVSLSFVFWFWLFGRFLDYSKSLNVEAEWGNIRNPAMIELRNKGKTFDKKRYIKKVLKDG